MSTYQQSARSSRKRNEQEPLSPTSRKAQDIYEDQNEIGSECEPRLHLRAKTQLVVEGVQRYMGEEFKLPERHALGFVGAGEVEQFVDCDRPLDWMQNAPGPREADRGRTVEGSRESADPDSVVGEQRKRQQEGAEDATELQRQLDQTREHGEPGGSARSSEEQMEGEDEDEDEEEGGENGMGREEREERGERRGRGEEREERWMQRLITEQQETIDTQAETIETLVHQLGEEEEDEERRERRGRRRGERGERGERGRDRD